MRLLLDTHVLLWVSDESLGRSARSAIEGAQEVLVSAATIWEIEIKRASGRLEAPEDFMERADRAGYARLPITFEHARAAGRLPMLHTDPFDRMLVAQARLEGLTLVTADPDVAGYDVVTLMAAQR